MELFGRNAQKRECSAAVRRELDGRGMRGRAHIAIAFRLGLLMLEQGWITAAVEAGALEAQTSSRLGQAWRLADPAARTDEVSW